MNTVENPTCTKPFNVPSVAVSVGIGSTKVD